MKNNYWRERAVQREQESYLRGLELNKRLYREYATAAKEIQREIEGFYGRYATEQGLTYREAVRVMSRAEMREWQMGVGEYVARIAAESDAVQKAALTAQLDALSYNSAISRLDATHARIELMLKELFAKATAELQREFAVEYVDSYYKKLYDIQAVSGFRAVGPMSEDLVRDVLTYPWSGSNFSARLWKNGDALVHSLREVLTQGVVQGKSTATLAQELAGRMGQSFKAAERVVRTEMAHFHAEGDLAAYREAGYEEYEYMATLDMRTSEVCGALDGEIFKVADAQAGVNCPPMHPNCRSTTVGHDPEAQEGRAPHKTYKQWYDEQVAINGEGYVEKERRKEYNKSIDLAEYKQYTDELGKNAPASFKDYQDIRYGGEKEYGRFKAYASSIKSGLLTPLADYPLYKEVAETLDNRFIGLTTKGGTVITEISRHFVERTIGSIEDRRSGVQIDDIFKAVTEPRLLEDPKSQKTKSGAVKVSQRYIGDNIAVTINPDTGTLIQTNPK